MLRRLESVISKDIPALMQMDCQINESIVEDFRKFLAEEGEKIKTSIVSQIGQVSKKKEVRKYIRHQQQNLIVLNSSLIKHTYPEKLAILSNQLESTVLFYYTYKTLEDLLNFMENHFTGYFDPDAWLPLSYRLIAVHEIKQDIELLETKLVESNVDHKLVTIIFVEFWQVLDVECTNEITWRKVKYLKVLKNELMQILELDNQNKTDSIRELLISLNFNTASFFTYYTNLIIAEFNAVEDSSNRFEKLALCMKQINQVRDRHGYIFDIRYRPIKEQITAWLGEELNFHQTTQLSLDLDHPNQSNSNLAKIELDLPVAQLSCLLYGFKEGEIIKNKKMLDVFRTISETVTSKRSDKLSAEGLRTRYYNIEHSARTEIIRKLRMVADLLSRN